jgi:hypothetical protein
MIANWMVSLISTIAALVFVPANARADLYLDLGNFLPTGINNEGQIVGLSTPEQNPSGGLRSQILVRNADGTTQILGTGLDLGTTQGSIPGFLGAGINNRGEVVWNTSQGAVIREPDGSVNTITKRVANSFITGINDSDKIVGFVSGFQQMCLFGSNCSFVSDLDGNNATFFQLALETKAFAINDNGQTTGTTHNSELGFERNADGSSELFKYACSIGLSCSPSFQDIGLGINSLGQIAGAEGAYILCSAFPGYCPPGVTFLPAQGFVMQPDGSFTIFNYPGASKTILTGIDDKGDVVGQYFMADGSSGGFFVATVPEPSGVILLGSMLVAVGVSIRRKRLCF